MATVSITLTYAEGGSLEVLVDVDESYPDACSEAAATAIRAYTAALGLTHADEGDS